MRFVTYNFDTKKFDAHLHKNDKDYVATTDFTESTNIKHTGFLAQDIEALCKKLGYDFDGLNIPKDENGNYSVAYSQFVMPLVKAVQELDEKVKTLEVANAELQRQNAELKAQADEIKSLRKDMEAMKALMEK